METPRLSDDQTPFEDVDGFIKLPDYETVTVRSSNREIVLSWPTDVTSKEHRMIRLVRVSDDGVEPRLWKIENYNDRALGNQFVDRYELDWLFAFLSLNNEIIDQNGTIYAHPGLVRLSILQSKEHETCPGASAA